MSALSVRAISKRAGLSTIGIYSHFDGKQGILDALYIEGFERVADAMDISDLELPAKERVLECARAYLAVADQYGAHYRLIFGESSDSYQPSNEAKEVAERAFLLLVKGVGTVLPNTSSDVENRQEALNVWAIVHGYVGLKNHAVSQIMTGTDWNALALQAVATHIDAIDHKFN